MTPAEAKADLARWRSAPSDFLLDPGGEVGRLYGARATPNMVVIDRSGRVAYMGAIDDMPSTRLADVKTAHDRKTHLAMTIIKVIKMMQQGAEGQAASALEIGRAHV